MQDDNSYDQAENPVRSRISPFWYNEHKAQSKTDKYRTQRGKVIQTNMECMRIQIKLQLQSSFQTVNLLIKSELRLMYR